MVGGEQSLNRPSLASNAVKIKKEMPETGAFPGTLDTQGLFYCGYIQGFNSGFSSIGNSVMP